MLKCFSAKSCLLYVIYKSSWRTISGRPYDSRWCGEIGWGINLARKSPSQKNTLCITAQLSSSQASTKPKSWGLRITVGFVEYLLCFWSIIWMHGLKKDLVNCSNVWRSWKAGQNIVAGRRIWKTPVRSMFHAIRNSLTLTGEIISTSL